MAASQSLGDSVASMNPLDTLDPNRLNVWLKGLYFFEPRDEGFLGFTEEWARTKFLERTKPGVLVVIYGTGKAPRDDRGKILGILQLSHRAGDARLFMSDKRKRKKEENPEELRKWNYALQAVRAWKVPPEARVMVEDFADKTYTSRKSRHISVRGEPLVPQEALKILKLNLYEVNVSGQPWVGFSTFGAGAHVLTPSRPGPVSQSPYMVSEAEGPKHLYILNLKGNADAFLGKSVLGRLIVKVGFSGSPERRCCDFNRTLPKGAFHWTIHKSTFTERHDPFPSSDHALAGEQVMKDCLETSGKSLGGEFFLAGPEAIEAAWRQAVAAAEKRQRE